MPGGATFFVNGVPVGGRRRGGGGGGARPGVQEIALPPWVTALVQTVPPPLIVLGLFLCATLGLQLVGLVLSVVAPLFPVIMPIMFVAPQHMKLPLIGGVVALSLLGML